MHKTNSKSKTVIPSTNSRSRAVILTQNKPKANSKNNSKPKATKKPSANKLSTTKKPKAIFESRAIMPSTIQKPRAINLNSNAKRIDLKQDLQITSSLNKQQRSFLYLKRILRLIFKVQENQLITKIL